MNNAASRARKQPLRYRWLKRIAVGAAVFLTVLLALRLWWGHVAYRPLQAEIDRILAAGEPLFPEDFNTPSIADSHNAAVLLERAAQALNDWNGLPLDWDQEQRFVENNANVIELVRQARRLGAADWNVTYTSPVSAMPNRSFARPTRVVWFLSLASRHFHKLARDARAIDALRLILAVMRMMEQAPTSFAHDVALRMRSVAVTTVEEIAPTLRVSDGPTDLADRFAPASRPQVMALIADLLDESEAREALFRDIHEQRMRVLDAVYTATEVDAGNVTPILAAIEKRSASLGRALFWPVKPILWRDSAAMIEYLGEFTQAAGAGNRPAMLERLPHELILQRMMDRGIIQLMAVQASIWVRDALDSHFFLITQSRMAAVRLAIRLYEVDHGRRPESLDDLVPDYLSAIPADPCGMTDRPLGYLPLADPPRLYSVGRNGIDDRGEFAFDIYGRVDHLGKDIPFFLDGKPPEPSEPIGQTETPTSATLVRQR